MNDHDAARIRLEELLAQRSTEGLDPADAAELERLSTRFPDVDTTAFDRIAATIWLAVSRPADAMPAGLRERILRRTAAE